MSLLGGILKSVINPMTLAQIAMGPAGWASIAMKAIGSAIAQQIIQKLGEQLGLPQPMIDLAQAAFAQASGQPGLARTNVREAINQIGNDYNLSHTQRADLERAANSDIQRGVSDFTDMYSRLSEAALKGKQRAERGSTSAKGGWLREIAALMSQALDSKIKEMKTLSAQIDKTKTTALQNDLQVATQEFSFLMNATANMIKTVGEGLGTMARKG